MPKGSGRGSVRDATGAIEAGSVVWCVLGGSRCAGCSLGRGHELKARGFRVSKYLEIQVHLIKIEGYVFTIF